MSQKVTVLLITMLLLISHTASAKEKYYGTHYCSKPNFSCYRVKQGDRWEKLFRNPVERDIIQRVNRMNIALRPGMRIAIPNNLSQISLYDVSPLPLTIPAKGKKQIIVDLNKLAWGAYDENGNMLLWGPASGGKKWCADSRQTCHTATGSYEIENIQDYDCISSVFPRPTGGAAMPYCMHYYRGYALHGSFEVPGYHASYGCVRMFITDARWLNHNFADYGTRVVVKQYDP